MRDSVVIIGAGPGGLASAILLASAGLKVTVIERLGVVGGRTSAIESEGFKFDLGPTFFLFPRVLEEIFAAAGESLRREVEMVRLDPQYRIIFGGGGALDATPDIARMEQQIAAIAAGTRQGFGVFLTRIESSSSAWSPVWRILFWVGAILSICGFSRCSRCCGRINRWTRTSSAFSAIRASAWPSHFSRNTSACRHSGARACFRSCHSSNTNMASSIRSAAAQR